MPKLVTYICDSCETVIAEKVPAETDPKSLGVNTVSVDSKSIDGTPKAVYLCGGDFDDFMDGTQSGNDLFLTD